MKMGLKAWLLDEKVKFLFIGGMNTLFGYGCFVVLYQCLSGHINYLLINGISHFISVVFSFSLYRHFVFSSQLQHPFWAFVKYNITVLNSLVSGLILMCVFVQYAQLSPIIAQAFMMAILIVVNYVAHKYFTFK